MTHYKQLILPENMHSAPMPEFYLDRLIYLLNTDFDFHNHNSLYASHNFHSFPAKFPPQLPEKFIVSLTEPGDLVLDPMVGSGTTILEASLNNRYGVGFDIDPLAIRISKVKTFPLRRHDVLKAGATIISDAKKALADFQTAKAELEHFFKTDTKCFLDKWFLPEVQVELFALVNEIKKINDADLRNFFEVVFSSIIITKTGGVSMALDLGHTRPHVAKRIVNKSGDVLFGDKEEAIPNYLVKTLRSPVIEFEKRYRQNAESLLSVGEIAYKARVDYGDAQNVPLDDNSVDLIITSPPYASNAIDYMRAHKFALIWLGYPLSDLTQKRKEYIGGEAIDEFQFANLPARVNDVIQKIQNLDQKKGQVLRRYYSEMSRVIKEMKRVLKPGKAAIVVVGNSILKGIDTETPECLAAIGEALGFKVPAIGVRNLDRNKRMMPTGMNLDLNSQIQQRMHQEYILGFYKSRRISKQMDIAELRTAYHCRICNDIPGSGNRLKATA